jgi:nicotinamidase-related amidase
MMDPTTTAIILVGFQNEHFGPDSFLRAVVDRPERVDALLERTISLIRRAAETSMTIVSAPITFNPEFRALSGSADLSPAMAETPDAGNEAAEAIPALSAFGDRVLHLKGSAGQSAFANAALHPALQERKIRHVVLAGMVTSLSIDSTGRAARERGYDVTILSDCTSGRTQSEQDFFCQRVFPRYGTVADSTHIVGSAASV